MKYKCTFGLYNEVTYEIIMTAPNEEVLRDACNLHAVSNNALFKYYEIIESLQDS
jgi:hypothetical protein